MDAEDVLAEGVSELRRLDPVMERILTQGAVPTLRKRPPGFQGLAWIIVGQQLSVASADAIWTRLSDKLSPLTPAAIHAATDDALKSCGLSAPKIRTLRGAADAVASGSLALDDLINQPAEAAHAALTKLKGVGPWTADIYLMFCLGHCDGFAAGDLALQEAARLAYGLSQRPSALELAAIAERWRPWRTVAAKVLWAYYKVAKGREGLSNNALDLAEPPQPKAVRGRKPPKLKSKATELLRSPARIRRT